MHTTQASHTNRELKNAGKVLQSHNRKSPYNLVTLTGIKFKYYYSYQMISIN